MRKDSGAGTQKVTIQDIADLAGVSKSTVSRYLNRGYISEAKAARTWASLISSSITTIFTCGSR